MLVDPRAIQRAASMSAPPGELPIAVTGIEVVSGAQRLLDGLSLVIAPGGPTALVGPNGAGKSTLLRVLKGLVAPVRGTITYAGRPQPAPGRHAMVLQRPVMLRRSAGANVAFALASVGAPADPRHIEAVLEDVGLAGFSRRPARALSGGEQQRLALARALARNPQVLYLDEPTASLDPAATKAVEEIITAAARKGVKVVLATHDLGQARRIAGDVALLVRGRVVEHAAVADFFQRPTSREAKAFIAGDLVL